LHTFNRIYWVTQGMRAGLRYISRVISAVALIAVSGCGVSPLYVQTSGTAGPLQWEAIDLEPGRRIVDGKEVDVYDFTLVVRETRGVGLTFTRIKNDILQRDWEAHGESSERLELPPYCELQIPLLSTGFAAPLWTVTLIGAEEGDRPLQVAINAALPEPGAGRGQAATPAYSAATKASAAAQAPDSIASLSVAERHRIQVLNVGFTSQDFTPFFASGEERKVATVSGAAVTFDARVPQALRRGLRNVAGGLLSGSLRLNSTVTISIPLPSPFGTSETFRFTYVGREPRPGRCAREVFIAMADAGATAADEVGQHAFLRYRFVFGPGWVERERRLVGTVVDQIPGKWLGQIEGLTFNRDRISSGKPDFGGHYTTDGHAITIYDEAFKFSEARFAVSDRGAAAIAHELGHALDFAPLRKAVERYRAAVAAFERAFGRYAISGSDQYRIPSGHERIWETTNKEITSATQAMEAARSASGSGWEFDPATRRYAAVEKGNADDANNAFRKAAALDGPVRITEYAEKSWSEYFAECFSLYVLEPQLLELLRPNIYAYFAKQFPR
jgi:hypothetical protein